MTTPHNEQFGPKGFNEPNPSSIEDNSACEHKNAVPQADTPSPGAQEQTVRMVCVACGQNMPSEFLDQFDITKQPAAGEDGHRAEIDESLDAKERAEAERDKALRELGGLLQSGHKAEGQVIRLTAALLAAAREECIAAIRIAINGDRPMEPAENDYEEGVLTGLGRAIEAIRALPPHHTKPAKAEEDVIRLIREEERERCAQVAEKCCITYPRGIPISGTQSRIARSEELPLSAARAQNWLDAWDNGGADMHRDVLDAFRQAIAAHHLRETLTAVEVVNDAQRKAERRLAKRQLAEALAAKEQAEAERDEAAHLLADRDALALSATDDLMVCRVENARLTAALADAREESDKLWKALFWIDCNDPELTAFADEKFGLDMRGLLLTKLAKAEEKP